VLPAATPAVADVVQQPSAGAAPEALDAVDEDAGAEAE
jgi:hypothetical protein